MSRAIGCVAGIAAWPLFSGPKTLEPPVSFPTTLNEGPVVLLSLFPSLSFLSWTFLPSRDPHFRTCHPDSHLFFPNLLHFVQQLRPNLRQAEGGAPAPITPAVVSLLDALSCRRPFDYGITGGFCRHLLCKPRVIATSCERQIKQIRGGERSGYHVRMSMSEKAL